MLNRRWEIRTHLCLPELALGQLHTTFAIFNKHYKSYIKLKHRRVCYPHTITLVLWQQPSTTPQSATMAKAFLSVHLVAEQALAHFYKEFIKKKNHWLAELPKGLSSWICQNTIMALILFHTTTHGKASQQKGRITMQQTDPWAPGTVFPHGLVPGLYLDLWSRKADSICLLKHSSVSGPQSLEKSFFRFEENTHSLKAISMGEDLFFPIERLVLASLSWGWTGRHWMPGLHSCSM